MTKVGKLVPDKFSIQNVERCCWVLEQSLLALHSSFVQDDHFDGPVVHSIEQLF